LQFPVEMESAGTWDLRKYTAKKAINMVIIGAKMKQATANH